MSIKVTSANGRIGLFNAVCTVQTIREHRLVIRNYDKFNFRYLMADSKITVLPPGLFKFLAMESAVKRREDSFVAIQC